MKPALILLATLAAVATACSAPVTSPGSNSRGTSGASSGRSGGAPTASYDDVGGLGSMAHAFLASSPARKLYVEIDYVSGREPNQRALDHLSQVLNQVADKPGGLTVAKGNAIASSRSTYSVADIRALERANRNHHSSGDTATMWVVYVNGSYTKDGTLGIAFDATSAAIFRDEIDNATTAIVNEAAIERADLTHEVGHLLSLVSIGYSSPRDREDPKHPHHSTNDRSVMFWAVEDVSIKNILAGGPPDNFDDDDLADLAMVKAG